MDIQIFADKAYQRYTNNKINNIKISNKQLKTDVVAGGIIAVNQSTHAYGVFDENKKFVKSSLQYKGKTHQFIPKYPQEMDVIDNDAMFLGYVIGHFGHFLLEQLSRAWGALEHRTPGMKFVFVNNRNIDIPHWLYKFMEMLGISKNDVVILNSSCKFRRVFVPEQAFKLSNTVWFAPEFRLAFRTMADNVKSKYNYDKVYVSRSMLPKDMKTYGEEKIQNIFADNGFKIIYPETMDLMEQIAIIKNARVLAGCAGTALHLALFMKNADSVIQIKRNSILKDSAYVQYAINQLVGAKSVFVSASVEIYKSGHGGNHAPQIIGITKYMHKLFLYMNFKYQSDGCIVDDKDWDAYKQELQLFQQNNGSCLRQKIKNKFIKYLSCFVPGRINRDRFRRWLKNHL